jgi:DNA repair photolyase
VVWDKRQIINDYGDSVEALTPVIISASRSTDIPAFYSKWFFQRLKAGYSVWVNPFNGVKSYISYANVRLIVFWSKNPEPLLLHWDYLKQRHIHSYLHFTLNNYEEEGLESGVPSTVTRIETFKRLVDMAGFGKIIWRFDPLILTDTLSTEDLLHKVEYIGNRLYGYTEKLVFSFAKIENYHKVKQNLKKTNICYRNFSQKDIHFFVSELCRLNKKWKYNLAACSEEMDLTQYGIQPNKCIDDDLIIKYFSEDKALMDFLGIKIFTPDIFHSEKTVLKTKNNKDKGQRPHCGCIISKDIGQYNTCPHGCVYCYANTSAEIAKTNFCRRRENMFLETLI